MILQRPGSSRRVVAKVALVAHLFVLAFLVRPQVASRSGRVVALVAWVPDPEMFDLAVLTQVARLRGHVVAFRTLVMGPLHARQLAERGVQFSLLCF